jgi:hypothetical protein
LETTAAKIDRWFAAKHRRTIEALIGDFDMTIFAQSVSDKIRSIAVPANQNSSSDVSGAPNERSSAGAGRFVLDPANSIVEAPASAALPARRGDLKPADRDTFDLWARRVVAFYSLLAIALLGAMLLGAQTTAGRNDLLAAHSSGNVAPDLSDPAKRGIVK